jgi:hypothetical protein
MKQSVCYFYTMERNCIFVANNLNHNIYHWPISMKISDRKGKFGAYKLDLVRHMIE